MYSIGRPRKREFKYTESWPIDRSDIATLKLIIDEVDQVSTFIDQLTTRVCSTRCTVSVQSCDAEDNSKEQWSDALINQIFDSQLNRFEKEVVRNWVGYGYAIGRYTYSSESKSSDRSPKDVILNSLEPSEYDVRWKYDENENIIYAVFPLIKEVSGVNPNAPQQVAAEQQKEVENTFVLPFAKLDARLSRFKSILSAKRKKCGTLRLVSILTEVGVLRQVFPLVVKKFTSDKYQIPLDSITPEILTSVNAAITDPGNTKFSFAEVNHAMENASRNGVTEIVRTMDSDPRNVSAEINKFFSSLDLFSPTLKKDLLNIIGEDPLKPTYTLMPGVSIDKDAPKSQLPAYILDYVKKLEGDIREGFGMPRETGESDITANVVNSTEQWLFTTQDYRVTLEKVIRGLFWDIYGICFTDRKTTFPALMADRSLSKIPTYVNLNSTEGKQKKRVVDNKKPYVVAATRKYTNLLDREVVITVTYSPTTSSDLQDVILLYEQGVIGFEAFQRLASSAARIPLNSHLKLTPEEYTKLDKKKIKDILTRPTEQEQQQQQQKLKLESSARKESAPKRQKLDSMKKIEEKQRTKEKPSKK